MERRCEPRRIPYRVSAALAAVAAVVGCGGNGGMTGNGPTIASVTISSSGSATLNSVGETLQLVATAKDASDAVVPGATFSWHGDNPSVATVGLATGLVTAERSGIVHATAASGGATSAPFQVTVALPIASVAVTPSSMVIANGKSFTFQGSGLDAVGGTLSGLSFDWSSADPAHAPVDSSGTVSASLDTSAPGAYGMGPITVTAVEPVSMLSGGADASVAVYKGWTFQAETSAVQVDVANGQYVIFANTDAAQHTVVLDSGSTLVGAFTGDSAPYHANLAAGSYPFHCSIHPAMKGTLTVH